jgi:hypothetical protein
VDLAGKDVEIDARDRVNARIDLVDPAEFERRLGAGARV